MRSYTCIESSGNMKVVKQKLEFWGAMGELNKPLLLIKQQQQQNCTQLLLFFKKNPSHHSLIFKKPHTKMWVLHFPPLSKKKKR